MFNTVNKATDSEIWILIIFGYFLLPLKGGSCIAQGKIQPTSRSSTADYPGSIE